MAELLSLKELKAQNAEAAALKGEEVEGQQEVTQDEYIEDKPKAKAVASESIEGEEAGEDNETIESWMQTEEAETSDDDQTSGFVPDAKAANRRKKAKALKSLVKEQDTELETLRKQVEALSSPQQPQAPMADTTPQLPDDLYDDEAMRKYHNDMIAFNKNGFNQYKVDNERQVQEQQAQAQQQAMEKNLGDHYERAQKLIDDGKITTESYQSADKNVRLALNGVSNGNGDNLANQLISALNNLGQDSEKVMYQLGVNPAKLQKLQNLLSNDPAGLSAMAYLGGLQKEISTPTKRRSQAPTPASKVEGEGGEGGQFGTLQKQYNKLTEPQERISFKRKAKKAGVDVRNW